MLVIPFATSQTDFNVFVALEQDNIARMQAYDPAQIEPRKMGYAVGGNALKRSSHRLRNRFRY